MNIVEYNRAAWNKEVEKGNKWTVPVSPEMIDAARRGEFSVLLTEAKQTPREWFPADLNGVDILCLASGGGQQAPILAATGANVTVLDNYTLPYSDLESLTDVERRRYTDKGEPLEFSHTLEDQIGGQLEAGFVLTGFYEDYHSRHPLGRFMPTYAATRAQKL